MRAGEKVFVDTGAWIALAITRDPLHERAVETWDAMARAGTKPVTSVPVILETFTYLDRKGSRELALHWRRALADTPHLDVLGCTKADIESAWQWLERPDFHKLGLVDATSFVLMRRLKISRAFAFDVHFGQAGFQYVG